MRRPPSGGLFLFYGYYLADDPRAWVLAFQGPGRITSELSGQLRYGYPPRGRHHLVALAVVCFDVTLRVLQVARKQFRLQFEAPPVEAQVDALWELC